MVVRIHRWDENTHTHARHPRLTQHPVLMLMLVEHPKPTITITIQRLGFFRPLLFQENYVETLRFELQMYLR